MLSSLHLLPGLSWILLFFPRAGKSQHALFTRRNPQPRGSKHACSRGQRGPASRPTRLPVWHPARREEARVSHQAPPGWERHFILPCGRAGHAHSQAGLLLSASLSQWGACGRILHPWRTRTTSPSPQPPRSSARCLAGNMLGQSLLAERQTAQWQEQRGAPNPGSCSKPVERETLLFFPGRSYVRSAGVDLHSWCNRTTENWQMCFSLLTYMQVGFYKWLTCTLTTIKREVKITRHVGSV